MNAMNAIGRRLLASLFALLALLAVSIAADRENGAAATNVCDSYFDRPYYCTCKPNSTPAQAVYVHCIVFNATSLRESAQQPWDLFARAIRHSQPNVQHLELRQLNSPFTSLPLHRLLLPSVRQLSVTGVQLGELPAYALSGHENLRDVIDKLPITLRRIN